jgi:hypothetical protein
LEENIEEDKAVRKMDHGQLSKQNKTSMSVLENLVENKERHAGEALKERVKLT